jgi:signal transduction histidine kinase
MTRRLASGAPPATLAERLAEAEHFVDQTIASVQRIAVELRPSALDALGLAAAIRDEARRFEARCGVATSVAIDSVDDIEPTVATALFRILQELMTNVARHANARRLGITLADEGQGHVLQVVDDGVGIAAEHTGPATSLGLLGMAERAGAVGGSFTLQRQPQGGTLATVRVPRAERPERACATS